jgi:hypothetical protein
MNSDAMVDVDSIHERLTAITPGTWWRVGGDIFAPGDQRMPLLRGRVRTADVRVQSDAPSLSTSGETLTIEESMTLRARTENAGHVGDEHEWSWSCA